MFLRFNNRDSKIKRAFERVKEELDDHLTSINQNTQEIQSLYDYIYELEEKIEKLKEKIEQVQLSLSTNRAVSEISDLSIREQEVFLLLYTTNDFLSLEEISQKTGLRDETILECVDSLIRRGVAIVKKQIKDKQLFMLDEAFRELQAKSSVVKVNEEISKQFSRGF